MYKGKTNIEIVQSYLDGIQLFPKFGYTAAQKVRKLGETWEDGKGITWEQKNGYKCRVNKQADLIRKTGERKCACGQNIQYGNHLDQKTYSRTQKCFECLIKEETELRILGVFPLYEHWKLVSNYLGNLVDIKEKIRDSIKYFENEGTSVEILCNGDGYLEKFEGINSKELLVTAKNDLTEVNKKIKEVVKEKNKAKKLYEKELQAAKNRLISNKE
jgi:hypothetical protein